MEEKKEEKKDVIGEILERVLNDLGITEERIDVGKELFEEAFVQFALAEGKEIPHVILASAKQSYELFGDVLLNTGKLSSKEVHNLGIRLFEITNSPAVLTAKLDVVNRIKLAGQNAGFSVKQSDELAFSWYNSTAKLTKEIAKQTQSQPKIDGNVLGPQVVKFIGDHLKPKDSESAENPTKQNEIISTILDPEAREAIWGIFQVLYDAFALLIQGWWEGISQDYLDRRLSLLHGEYEQLKSVFSSAKSFQLVSQKFIGF
ncbi:MAG: hypothetical protein LBO09_02605 [Candidatus Peribacteria bacterium]|jgi:hypothetical protein|nr:hypothetical protein [Candidatus Peribacteria bacterium]